MTIYNGGSELGCILPSDTSVVEVTDSGYFDSGFSRCAIYVDRSTNYCEVSAFANLTEFWLHCDLRVSSFASASGPRLIFYDSSDVARVQMLVDSGANTVTVQYDVGAGWVTAGSAISLNLTSARQTLDFRILCNTASGSINLYVGGTERVTSGTINLSAITNIEYARGFGDENGVIGLPSFFSQFLVSNTSTIGKRVMSGYPSGAGANTAWTGDHTAVDETSTSDADFIFSATNGQRETYAITYVGSLTGYTAEAMIVGARAKWGGTGPENLQITIVSGATTSDSSSHLLSLGYTPKVRVADTDPNTSVAWTNANIILAQAGVEANT
jgi:hypothetical protein